MVRSPSGKHGCRPICKLCKNAQQVGKRKEYVERLAQAARKEQEARRADLVPARTFVPSRTEYWTPDTNVYYRNNGNKHIPSKGVPT